MTPRRLTFAGWDSFSLSGVFFVASALRSGELWALAGSVIWILGVGLIVLATMWPC